MAAKLPVLSADQIAAALDLAEIDYDVPEWNGSVKLKAFTIDDRDKVLSACTEKDGQIDAKKLIRLLVVHGMIEPKLTLDVIATKSFAVVERIAQEVMKLNGMSQGKGPSAATVADATFRQES